MRSSRSSANLLRNGPDGFRHGSTPEQRRSDFLQHIINNDTDGRGGQFDGVQIVGSSSILPPVIGRLVKMYNKLPKKSYKDWVLIASSPFQVWANSDHRDQIIAHLAKKIGVVAVPSEVKALLFKMPFVVSSHDFLEMIDTLKIDQVAVKSYGEKASIAWGVELMKTCRSADPDCEIEFDVAANIPADRVHWMRQDHMVPEAGGPFLTLARWTGDTAEFHREFGNGSRIYHEPLFVIPQMWWFAGVTNNLPAHGGIEVEMRGQRNSTHTSLLKFNIYNNALHQVKQMTTTGFETWEFNSVNAAKTRLHALLQHLHHFSTMHPQLRIEARFRLDPKITANDLEEWQDSLYFVWDALLAAWGSLSLVNIPTSLGF